MRKRLVMPALLVLFLVCGARSQVLQDGSEQTQPAQGKGGETPAPAPPCICNVRMEDAPQKRASGSQEEPSQYPWRELLAPTNIPSWFLVGVGFWAGLMALRSLRRIGRQADLMNRQNVVALAAAKAAQENAKTAADQIRMMKDKERGRLRLDFEDLDLTRTPSINTVIVSFRICLDGSTQAYVLDAECFAGVFAKDEVPSQRVWSPPMAIPPVVTPAMGPVNSFTLVHHGVNLWTLGLSEPTILSVQDSESRVCCEGHIRYRDVFGGTWRFNFKRRWEYFCEPLPEDEAWQGGQWEKYGGPEDNGEYEIEPVPEAN